MSQNVIDDGVVKLTFDNKEFEKGVQTSLNTLDKLEKSLQLKDGSKSLQQLGTAVEHVDFAHLQAGVDDLNKKLSTTGTIGRAAITKITWAAMDLAKNGLKKVTSSVTGMFETIRKGGEDRAKNIADAKFQLKGLGIAWEDIAGDIDYAVADTAFGLDSAAKAAAQLSASQVQIGDDMKAALRGISGVAAMTNSEYDDIARIFTTVAGNGRLMTDQLNQMSYKGLNAAASLAEAFNKDEEAMAWFYESYTSHAKKNDEAIVKGAEISERAVRTLVTNGGLDFEHFAKAMDNAFGEHAKDANSTYAGSLANVNAALKKIGAEFAGPAMDNMINVLNEVRLIFNDFRKIIQPAVDAFNELEYVVLAKVSNVLAYIRDNLGGLGGFVDGVAGFLESILNVVGGEELEQLNKTKEAMKAINNEEAKSADAIAKTNEARRLVRKSQTDNIDGELTYDEALKQVLGTMGETAEATGEYSKSAEEMHNAIQGIWSSKYGQSWDERKRLLMEEGFSEAEVAEIQSVVNAMRESGRTASSDIDTVYKEVDETLDKSKKDASEFINDIKEGNRYLIDSETDAIAGQQKAAKNFTKSAEEMHDAIQGIWSEKTGKSWEERTRILTEEGFSEDEIDEIHAVVDEMKKSGRTLSSDIDDVYEEVDSKIEKTTDLTTQQIDKLSRDEERYFENQTASVEKTTTGFEKVKTNITGFVGSIRDAFQNVFLNKGEKKPFESMTTAEKVFNGLFRIINFGGQAAGAALSWLWKQAQNLWNGLKESKIGEWVSEKIDGILKALNDLDFDKVKEDFENFKKSISENKTVQSLLQAWSDLKTFFGNLDLFGAIQEGLKNLTWENIVTKFEEIKESIKNNGLWKTIQDEWDKAVEYVKNNSIFDAFSDAFENFKGTDTYKTLSEFFISIEEGFAGLFGKKGEVEGTGEEATSALETVQTTAETANSTLETIMSVIGKVKSAIEFVTDKISPLLSGLTTPDGIMGFLHGLEALGIIGVLRSVRGFFKNFGKIGKAGAKVTESVGENLASSVTTISKSIGETIGNFGSIGSSIAGVLDSYGAVNKATAREANTKAILNVALAIGALAASLWILSKIPQNDLIKAGIALAAIAGGVVIVSIAMGAFMEAKAKLVEAQNASGGSKGLLAPLHDGFEQFGKGISKIGTAAIIISVAVAVMAFVAAIVIMKKAIESYAKMDDETFEKGGERVAKVFGAMVLGIVAIGAACKGAGVAMLGVAPTILALVVALVAVYGIIKLFARMDKEEFVSGGWKVAAVVGAMVLAVSLIGKALKDANWATMLAAALVITTLTVAIGVFTAAILLLSLVPTDRLAGATIAISGAILALSAGVAIMGKALKDVDFKTMLSTAVVILSLSASIAVLTAAIVVLSLLPFNMLLRGAITVSALVLVLSAGVSMIAKSLKDINPATMASTAAVLITMSVAIGVITLALVGLSLLPTSRLITSTIALSAILLVMSNFAKSLSKMKDGKKTAASILAMAAVIGVISYSLYQLSSINAGDLAAPTIALGAIITILSGFAKSASGLKKSWASILMIGVVVGAIAGVLYLLSEYGNVESYLPIATSIGVLLAALSGSIRLLSGVGVVGGAKAAGAILAFVGIFTAVGLVLGAIDHFADGAATKGLEMAGDMVGKLGEVIGKFIGGIAAGALKEINKVPQDALDKIVGFISDIAAIEIPTQTEFKWNEEGISYVDKSLVTFAKGMKGVIEAVNTLDLTGVDEESLATRESYFTKIASFVSQLAAIDIPTQYEFTWDENGLRFVDQSLNSFANGMKGIVTAVNDLKAPDNADELTTKAEYFEKVAGFTSALAAITIPTQSEFTWTWDGISYVDSSLRSFADGMQGVVKSVNALEVPENSEDLERKATYFTNVATFTNELAKIDVPVQTESISQWGGWLKSHEVDSSLRTFAAGMQGVVTAVNMLETPPDEEALNNKSTYLTNVAGFVNQIASIPVPVQTETITKWGGFVETHDIDSSLTTFAKGLQGVVTASNELDLGITDVFSLFAKVAQFKMVAGFVEQLAAIEIPEQTSNFTAWGGLLSSESDSSLITFAQGMGEVSKQLNKMTPPSITETDVQTMANCVAHMAKAASEIPPQKEGLAAWLSGDTSLSGFAEQMAESAGPIKTASESATGINLTNIQTMSQAITEMATVLTTITAEGISYSDKLTTVQEYSTLVGEIGSAFASFDGLQNVSAEDIKKIPGILQELATVSAELTELDKTGGLWTPLGTVGAKTENPFQTLIDYVEQLGSTSTNVENITNLATALQTLSSTSVADFASGFNDTSGQVKIAVDGLIQNAVTAITETSTDTTTAFQEAGSAFLAALAEGMKDTSGISVEGADTGGAQALVTQMANSINSDSNKEIFVEAGQGFLSSLAKGMSDTTAVSAPAGEIVGSIYNAIMLQRLTLVDVGKALINSITKGFKDKRQGFVDEAGAAAKAAKAGAASYENAFYNVGSNMGMGLRDGMNAWAGPVASKAAQIVRDAMNAAKREGQISSPSKKMIEIGKFMDLGLATGLDKYSNISNKAAAGVAGNIIDTVDSVLDIHSPSKVMYKKGKQTVQGYAYGVDKNGKILVKSTKKAAKKALKAQVKVDKKGEAQRIANQRMALEAQLKNASKSNKKIINSQIKALKKLQKDYGKVAAKGTTGLTKKQLSNAEVRKKLAEQEKKRLDAIVAAGNTQIENRERAQQRTLTALEKQNIWKAQLKQLKAGTAQYKEVSNKIADLEREVANERVAAFEKERSDLAERQEVALADDLKYWQSKQNGFLKGSEAYTKVVDKIRSLNNQIYKNLNTAEKNLGDSLKDTFQSALERIDEIWKQYEEDIKSRGESLRDTSGLFDFFESGSYETSDTLIENLRSQVTGLEEFQDNMDKIRARAAGAGFDDEEGFLDALENMGPSANANLQNLINMTDEQWKEYIDLYNRRSAEAQEEARKDINISEYNKQVEDALEEVNKSIKDLTKNYYDTVTELGIAIVEPSITVSENMVDGMIKGITENEDALLAKVKSIAESTMSIANKTLGIASPSKKFALMGQYMDLGMAQGLEAFKYRVIDATADVGNESIQKMQDAIDYATFIATSDYDFNPVITPVLDDSQIIEGIGYIQQLMNQQQMLQMVPNLQTQGLTTQTSSQIQNGLILEAMNRLAGLVTANGGTLQITNEFNITSNNPREIAEEVSRLLDKEVQQKERTWA